MNIRIEKLERPEPAGDWHDLPLRWIVVGPGTETQKFPNQTWAKRYVAIRRRSANQFEAIRSFAL